MNTIPGFRRLPRTLLLPLLLWLLVPFATLAKAPAGKPEPAALATEAALATPALWRVENGDADLFLFGTIHALPAGTNWRNATLDRVFAAVDRLALEIDPARTDAALRTLVELGRLPPGETLEARLGPDGWQAFTRALEGADPYFYNHMRPWAAILMASTQQMQERGWDPENGVDQALWRDARRRRMEIVPLETGEAQIRMIAGIDESLFIERLTTAPEQMEAMMAEDGLMEPWLAGDEARLLSSLTDAGMADERIRAPLLDDRNRSWIPQLRRLIAEGRPVLVAVGAAHLVGENSVVDLLRREGLTVTRMRRDERP